MPKKSQILVGLFLIGLLLMAGYCESVRADVAIEERHDSNAGTTDFNKGYDRLCGRYFFETGLSAAVCPLIAIGGKIQSDSFEIAIADTFAQRYEAELQLNKVESLWYGGITGRRMFGDGPFQMVLGGTYWINESPGSNSDFTFQLGMRYTFR